MHEEFINFIISLIPTKLETYVGGGVAFVGVLLQHFIGQWNNQIEILLIFMIIDYITGLSAAYIMSNVYLDSRKGFKGIIKKIVYSLLGNISTSDGCVNWAGRIDKKCCLALFYWK